MVSSGLPIAALDLQVHEHIESSLSDMRRIRRLLEQLVILQNLQHLVRRRAQIIGWRRLQVDFSRSKDQLVIHGRLALRLGDSCTVLLARTDLLGDTVRLLRVTDGLHREGDLDLLVVVVDVKVIVEELLVDVLDRIHHDGLRKGQ